MPYLKLYRRLGAERETFFRTVPSACADRAQASSSSLGTLLTKKH